MLEKIHTSVNLLNKCHNCSQVFHLVTRNCICIAHCILESNISGSFSIFLIIKRCFRAFKMVTLESGINVGLCLSYFGLFQALRSLLERVMSLFLKFLFFGWRIFILWATFILFAKCKGAMYIYSRVYVYFSL